MTVAEKDFIKKLQNLIWQIFGGIALVAILAGVPFYFGTKNDIKNNQQLIKELKQNKADRITYELTVKQINSQLSEIKESIKEIKQK